MFIKMKKLLAALTAFVLCVTMTLVPVNANDNTKLFGDKLSNSDLDSDAIEIAKIKSKLNMSGFAESKDIVYEECMKKPFKFLVIMNLRQLKKHILYMLMGCQ